MQNEKTGTKHLFQSVLGLPDSFLANTNFIYELQRLAEKPAINFLMPVISSKKWLGGLLL